MLNPNAWFLQKLQALRHSSVEDRSKLEKRFKDRLKEMDVKMKDLHRKEKQFCQLERLKARSEETCVRLNSDIVAIKQQKVYCSVITCIITCPTKLSIRLVRPVCLSAISSRHYMQQAMKKQPNCGGSCYQQLVHNTERRICPSQAQAWQHLM